MEDSVDFENYRRETHVLRGKELIERAQPGSLHVLERGAFFAGRGIADLSAPPTTLEAKHRTQREGCGFALWARRRWCWVLFMMAWVRVGSRAGQTSAFAG